MLASLPRAILAALLAAHLTSAHEGGQNQYLPCNTSRLSIAAWETVYQVPAEAFAAAMAAPVSIPTSLPDTQLSFLTSGDRKMSISEAHDRNEVLKSFLATAFPDLNITAFKEWTVPLYSTFLSNLGLTKVEYLVSQAFHRRLLLGLSIVANKANEDGQIQLGLNHFAVLDPMETRFFTGNLQATPGPGDEVLQPPTEQDMGRLLQSLPASFDMRTSGKMPPIYNQLQCGSCWAFTSSSTLEIQNIFVNGNPDVGQLSEQELVSCDNFDAGCNGGNPSNTFKWIAKEGGLVSSKTFPYTNYRTTNVRTPGCNQNHLKPKLLSTDGKVVFLPKASTKAKQIAASEHAIMNAVYQGYPVTIQIGASSNCFQNYMGGVMTCKCNGPVDHVVLVVGWTPTTFIIRNQWGTSWGDQGYAYFPRGVKGGQCHMLSGGPMYLKDVTPVQSGRRSLRSSDAEA